ncbi:gamma-interferon-inducible lysosomal thiol reductase-like [Hyalella azteca]|uniref:Gamma-interferon-inducible lysosomal thiol reductase-like n=1 Tax=Hyalella azteca TaxID=294128 RepID=A0A979FJM9_HYAAZ|nr:gamma-interferon-inducible lysosomal thiol reductase-like [Hyalella azteca]
MNITVSYRTQLTYEIISYVLNYSLAAQCNDSNFHVNCHLTLKKWHFQGCVTSSITTFPCRPNRVTSLTTTYLQQKGQKNCNQHLSRLQRFSEWFTHTNNVKPFLFVILFSRKFRAMFLNTFMATAAALFACASAHVASSRADADPVSLQVFYESLCPDSIRFVEEQLAPVYASLSSILSVDITAYGFASDTAKPEGGYNFTCQHGPDECVGNLLLVCAKKYLPQEPEYIDFNICVMTAEYPPSAGEQCAAELGVSFAEISACWTSQEGEELLHEAGIYTAAQVPRINYVPWMISNGEHDDAIQAACEFDLEAYVCATYTGTPPLECGASKHGG